MNFLATCLHDTNISKPLEICAVYQNGWFHKFYKNSAENINIVLGKNTEYTIFMNCLDSSFRYPSELSLKVAPGFDCEQYKKDNSTLLVKEKFPDFINHNLCSKTHKCVSITEFPYKEPYLRFRELVLINIRSKAKNKQSCPQCIINKTPSHECAVVLALKLQEFYNKHVGICSTHCRFLLNYSKK